MGLVVNLTNKSNKELNASVVTTVDRETVECVVQHADVLQVNAASNTRNSIVTAEARFNNAATVVLARAGKIALVLHICS
jgi:3-deoxy-D-arabino-heptulosonate 7-phosphate (DAHP) synthase